MARKRRETALYSIKPLGVEDFDFTEVEDGLITNTPRYGKRPANLPWEYYLICRGYKRNRAGKLQKFATKFVHKIAGRSEDEANELLAQFVEQPNIKVLAAEDGAIHP